MINVQDVANSAITKMAIQKNCTFSIKSVLIVSLNTILNEFEQLLYEMQRDLATIVAEVMLFGRGTQEMQLELELGLCWRSWSCEQRQNTSYCSKKNLKSCQKSTNFHLNEKLYLLIFAEELCRILLEQNFRVVSITLHKQQRPKKN